MVDTDRLLAEAEALFHKITYEKDDKKKQEYQQQLVNICNQLVEIYNKIIGKNPNDSESYSTMGMVMLWLKKPQDAITYYDKAIETNPDNTGFYEFRATAKAISGDEQGALEDRGKSFKIFRKDEANSYKRAIIIDRLADYKGAIEYFNQEIYYFPKDDSAYYYRARAKEVAKDYKGAIEDYGQATKLNPSNMLYQARAYYLSGKIKNSLKEHKGAISDYQKLLSFKQSEIPALIIFIKITISYIKLLLHI